MAKATKEAKIIDAEPVNGSRGPSGGPSGGTSDDARARTGARSGGGSGLALVLSGLALLISLVALALNLLPQQGGPAPGGADAEAVAALDARLEALETAPAPSVTGDGGAAAAAAMDGLDALGARFTALETDTSTTLDRLDDALAALGQDAQATARALNALQTTFAAAENTPSAGTSTTATSPAASGTGDGEALSQIRGQLAGLSLSIDGSLTRIGGLYDDLADQADDLAALQDRLQSVETLGDDLPARVEAGQQALDDARTELGTQLDALSAALDDAVSASRADASAANADLQSALEQLRADIEARLAPLEATTARLNDDFRAMQQVSVQASTQILAASQLRDALAQAAPVRPHVQALAALQPSDPALRAVIEGLDASADDRIPTADNLTARLVALSPVLLSETRVNTAEGRTGKLLARITALISLERIDDVDALPGVEGALARALIRIEEGDFRAALAELEGQQDAMQPGEDTRQRFEQLVSDLARRADYEEQRAALRAWISAALAAAQAGDQS